MILMINTKVWAHRGASAYAPENSLEAFELAIQMGAHGIELDIYETADSKLVIHHDNDIKRMTNGVEAKIQETDFDTLRTYNFNGKWGDKYGFVRIPTLHEVLDLFRPTDKNINIELKEGSTQYLHAIYNAVKEFGMEEQVLYSSFDHTKLARMKAIHPNAKTGALYSEPLIYQPWNYAKMADFTALHPSYNQLYRFQEQGIDFVKEAHDAGIAVNPWTANKEGIMRRLAIWGVDYIITDYPDVALRIIKELNEAEA